MKGLATPSIDPATYAVPPAFFMPRAQLKAGVIVGTTPTSAWTTEQFGAVLAQASPLPACVSNAVDALRDGGVLTSLVAEWLAGQGAPELK